MKFIAALFVFLSVVVSVQAIDTQTNVIFSARARAAYWQAQTQYNTNADNPTNAWVFARSCYDAADFATNNAERALLAKQGIVACREMITRLPKSAPAHYYLAMDLGQLARTEWLGALELVKEMEREFKLAASLDATFDYAGPERNLGLLYEQAPTIGSIGNKRKARDYLERAVKLSPDYPENRLNLAEAFLEWNEPKHARTQLDALGSMWAKAQKNFTGEAWEQSWADWTSRRAVAEQKLENLK